MIEETTLTITRVVHSCALVDFGGLAILTDPWFTEKFGYHFGEPAGATVETLPKLAGVVVSHDHFDHNDMQAFGRYADKQVPIICQRAAAKKARKAGFKNVATFGTWETLCCGPVRITAVPALHGVPEIGFVLQACGFTVYFAGDTMMSSALSLIAQRFPVIDVALLPINGLKVFGQQVVMNPREAAALCKTLRPRCAIPIHYAFKGGAFTDSLFLKYFDRQEALPLIFREAVAERAPGTRVEILEPGKAFTLKGKILEVTGLSAAEPTQNRRRQEFELTD